MAGWFYRRGGIEAGPVSAGDLEYLLDRGELSADVEVRSETSRQWRRADESLPHLFPARRVAVAAAVSEPQAVEAAPEPEGPLRPLPPQLRGETEAERRRKQATQGTAIGAAAALLILLLLMLLLTWGGGLGLGRGTSGDGTSAGLGHGTGVGEGTGSGAGAGDGGGTGGGSGGATGASTDSSNDAAKDSSVGSQADPGTAGDAPSPMGTGEGDDIGADFDRAKKNRTQIGLAMAPPPQTQKDPGKAGAGSGDGGFSKGGGGGSDGSEFFGTKARGTRFVYVIDCSSSMFAQTPEGTRLEKAKKELMASLGRLKTSQSAYVIFFSSGAYPMFSPQAAEADLLKCTKPNVKKMQDWVSGFAGGGGTEPRQALLDALALRPHAIFFLTDGGFVPTVADDVRDKNHEDKKKTAQIHTICFVDSFGEPVMKQIAAENHGDYRFVP